MDAGTVEAAIVMRDLASAVVAKVETSLEKFGQTTRAVSQEVERASSAINSKLGKSLEGVGASMKSAGMGLTFGVTVPLAGASVAALKFAADYESNMKKVQVLSGLAAEDVDKFGKAMLGLGRETASGPNELAKAMLVVTSTGLRGAEALDITKVAAQGAAVGMGEAKDVARAVTSIMTAYGKENINAATAMDKLFVAVREGGAEADELAGSIGRVVGVGAELGVSFDEIGAYIATFTRLGVNAAEATTSIGAVMSGILDPTSEAANAIASAGLSIDELRAKIKDQGLAATLMELQDAFQGNTTAMAQVFGNVRALRGVLGNTGSQAAAYAEIVGKMGTAQGEFAAGVKEMSTTTAWSWKAMKAQLEATSIAFGQALMPALNSAIALVQTLLPYVQDAVRWFTALPQPIQNVALGFGALVIAAGPLTWIFGSAISMIGKMLGSEALGGLVSMLPKVAAEFGRLWLATTASGSAGFGIVIGEWLAKMPKLTGAFTAVSGAAAGFGRTLADAARTIGTMKLDGLRIVATDTARWFAEVAKGTPILGTFIQGLGNIGLAIKGLSFSSLSSGFSSLVGWVAQLATKIPMLGAAFTFLTGPVGLTIAAIAALLVGIRYLTGSWDFLTKPLKYVADLFSDLYVIAKDKLGKALADLASGTLKQLAAAWTWIVDGVKGAVAWYTNLWKSATDLASAFLGPLTAGLSAVGGWLLKTFPWLQTLVDWFGRVKAAVAEVYGWLYEKFGKAIEAVGGFVAGAIGKWNEWREGIKKTADEIRAKNKTLESTAIALDGIVAPAAAAGSGIAAVGAAAAAATKQNNSLVAQLAAIKKQLASLTPEQRANIQAGLEMKKTAGEIAAQMNVLYPSLRLTEMAVEIFKDGLSGAGAEAKKTKKDLQALNDMIDAFSGKTAAEDATTLATAIAKTGGAARLTREQLAAADETLRAYFDGAAARGEQVSAAVQKVGADVAAALAKANAAEFFAAPIKAGQETLTLIQSLGGVSQLTGDQLRAMGESLKAGLDAAVATGKALPGDWLAWKNIIDATVTSLEREAAAMAGIDVRRQAALEVAQRYVDVQKDVARMQDAIADSKWIDRLPRAWQELARAAVDYKNKLRDVKSGQEQANEMVAALGDKATRETIAAIQGMVPALEANAQAMREALAAEFGNMVKDANVAAGGIDAIFAALAANFPAVGALLRDAFNASGGGGKLSIKDALDKGGFTDYLKTGLGQDIIGAIQGGGDIGRTIATGLGNKIADTLGKQKDKLTGLGKAFAGAGAGVSAFFTGMDIGAKTGSKAMGALGGAATGAMQGFMVGGPLGAAVGGIAGLVGGLFGAAKAGKKLRDQFVENAGGMAELAKAAKYAGVSLDGLMKAKGKGDVEKEIKKIEAAIKAAQERVQQLTEDLATMADTGALAGQAMLDRIRKDMDKPEVQQAFAKFFESNLGRAADGLNSFWTLQKDATDAAGAAAAKVAEIDRKLAEAGLSAEQRKALEADRKKAQDGLAALKPTLQTAQAMSTAVAGVFAEMVRGGMTAVDALKALSPSITGLQAYFAQAGAGGGDAFDQISQMAALASDAISGPMLQSVAAIGTALTGLSNTGLLTEDMFAGLAAQVGTTYQALVDQGANGDTALRMMQPTLQKLWELQQNFGFEVDESTQKLIDQAVESGVVGEKFKSAQDRMADALDRFLGRMDALLETMGIRLPGAAAAGANGIEREFGRIRLPKVNVDVEYNFPDMPNVSVDVDPNVPGLATGGVVKRRTLATVGEAGPEAIVPLPNLKTLLAPDWQAIGAAFGSVVGPVKSDAAKASADLVAKLKAALAGEKPAPPDWQRIAATIAATARDTFGATDAPDWQQMAADLQQKTDQRSDVAAQPVAVYDSPEANVSLAELVPWLERGGVTGRGGQADSAAYEPPPAQEITVNIQALDPVGLKKVVEAEVAPLLVSAYRRNVGGLRTDTRKELIE